MMKILLGCLLVVGVFFGIQYLRETPPPSHDHPVSRFHLTSGTALPIPRALPEFKLIDHNQKIFSNKQLYDHWSFLFFGYTQCPGICPATLGKLNEIAPLLDIGCQTEFIFISIDPQNDTPSTLKRYFSKASFKKTEFLGVTGEAHSVQALAKALGLFVSENNIKINGHIDHSGTVLLINPEGKLAAIFTNLNRPHSTARDFKTLVHHYHQMDR